jgi:hypothetical protein
MIQKAKAMLLCFIVLASTARADEAKTLILPTPYEAWSAATKDAEANAKASDGFRYVWVQSSDPMDVLAVEWITNMVYSRATTLLPVQVVHKSAQCGAVVRLDFRALAHNEEDFRNLLKLWEDFAGTEPYFLARVDKQKIQVTPYVAKDGKTYDYRYESVRLPSEHLPTTALPDLTGSFVPVVEYRWWQKKSISTADGNLYYQFRGIPETLDEFLQKFAGVSEKDVENLRSDQKYAIFFSGVTGKTRAVKVFRGIGGRVGVNQCLVMITDDYINKLLEGKPSNHPIRTLLGSKPDAHEVIVELPNGCHVFFICDGNGKRVDEVPPNIAGDFHVPDPYEKRLQCAISCIRCHSASPDEDGIKFVENDVAKLHKSGYRVFGDAKDGFPDGDTVDRIYGLYSATLDKPFERARDDYSDMFVLLASKYNFKERVTVQQVCQHVSNRFDDYDYKRVYAIEALRAVGYDIQEVVITDTKEEAQAKREAAVALLHILVPDLPTDEIGIAPEDPVIGALKADIGIGRLEFEQIYADLAARARATSLLEGK